MTVIPQAPLAQHPYVLASLVNVTSYSNHCYAHNESNFQFAFCPLFEFRAFQKEAMCLGALLGVGRSMYCKELVTF